MACKLLFSFPDQCPRHHDGCRAGVCHPAQHHRETAVWPGALSCLQMSCSNNFSNEVSHFYCFLRSVLLNWDGAVRFILLCFLISDVKIMMCILPPYIRTMEAVDAGASLMEICLRSTFFEFSRIKFVRMCCHGYQWRKSLWKFIPIPSKTWIRSTVYFNVPCVRCQPSRTQMFVC